MYCTRQGLARLPSSLVYPSGPGGCVLERYHVAHVERYDVVELDALVRGGSAQTLPVPRHLRHGIASRQGRGRSGDTLKKLIYGNHLQDYRHTGASLSAASVAAGTIVG